VLKIVRHQKELLRAYLSSVLKIVRHQKRIIAGLLGFDNITAKC